MSCIQCLNVLGCEHQRQRNGILFYMRRQTSFGDCNDVAPLDYPGECNRTPRTIVRCAGLRKRNIV